MVLKIAQKQTHRNGLGILDFQGKQNFAHTATSVEHIDFK